MLHKKKREGYKTSSTKEDIGGDWSSLQPDHVRRIFFYKLLFFVEICVNLIWLVVEEPVPNGHRNTTDNALQPINTYQLRGRNVLPKCGQPPLSQKRDHEYTRIAGEGPVDRSQIKSTSEESSRISNSSVLAEGSKTPVYQSQHLQQTKGQHIEDPLGQSLHTRNYTQSDNFLSLLKPPAIS